ncbi:4-hydroxy-tetrahydrodipicolinate reductase [Coriobacteriia bacterium Es71-Z0120]|uniref:4-hydroxy-tetrahydrodipicolinate reductase n=1 Tax=Parvivirga hydrogeniphila TaxID=2939460 RepID=UPI002260B86A|nr:4-hydroxy-tetrahydrodipicolinate reductase [Parvivirga hydrogeniphila]MCL4079608.1 4-hydroxy-tetrahydrodipicolinate reductase [Parvivirga hydrogeniphila]
MIRVVVTGASGKMGREVVRAVTAEPDMTVVAAVDPLHAGEAVEGIRVTGDLRDAIEASSPDVLVDFTRPEAVAANVRAAASSGIDCVVGTTGVPIATFEEIAEGAPEGVCVFVAPNFAIGAVLMMRFAREAARYLPHVEIVELHHDRKADAPSGTAIRTAEGISQARTVVPAAPGRESEVADGARGAVVAGVTVHSVRLPGLVAHQEVIFGGPGQTLTIRHDSLDRTSFMPGVVMAIRAVRERSGLVVGLEEIL